MKFLPFALVGAAAALKHTAFRAVDPPPPHKTLYYLEAALENVCYETTYTDPHYQENGFKLGSCDESYNTVISNDNETVCNGHSEVNVKDCTTGLVNITILKLGKTLDSETATDPPHQPMHYLEAALENVCYETTYTDEHYQENGFKLGSCDESYNTVISHDIETVCNGHSEVNVKDCTTGLVNITILKLGKTLDSETATDPPHQPFYHLESTLSNLCYETTYTDEHYQENGFKLGSCDESYDKLESTDYERVCNGHSEVNVKDCPTDIVQIKILKFGKSKYPADALSHKPYFHLETKLSNLCYETTYTDEHYRESGFKIGACDETYDKIESKDIEKVCNGHSEVNVKDCPTEVVDITILKLGKN